MQGNKVAPSRVVCLVDYYGGAVHLAGGDEYFKAFAAFVFAGRLHVMQGIGMTKQSWLEKIRTVSQSRALAYLSVPDKSSP